MWLLPAACILDELELTIKTLAVERRLRPIGGEPVPSNVKDFHVNVSDYFSVVAGKNCCPHEVLMQRRTHISNASTFPVCKLSKRP
jgi:hypothetical protein